MTTDEFQSQVDRPPDRIPNVARYGCTSCDWTGATLADLGAHLLGNSGHEMTEGEPVVAPI